MRTAALLAVLLLGACDSFDAVQQKDTIEAYEDYLAKNPTSSWRLQAQTRLEELLLDKAKSEKSLDLYDAYLTRFPEGIYVERAREEREDFLWAATENANSVAEWKKFLEDYPRTNKKRRERAERMLKMAQYADKVALGPTEMEQVNLAENPEGPLDGWSFKVPVTNNGDKTIKRLDLTIEYLDVEGKALDRKDWPVVADWWSIPIEEDHKIPMKKGDTRTWWWTTGDLPAGWGKRVKVYASRITFMEEE